MTSTSTRPRALVVVESRHGSTREIAGALAQRLVFHGFQAHVAEPGGCNEIDADVVVIGSAIYRRRWLRPALRFVDDHAARLAQLPVWVFSSGPLAAGLAVGDGIDETYIAQLAERAHARGHRIFAGRLDRASLGPVEAFISSAVHAPDGDYRDWPEINAWADEIAHQVSCSTISTSHGE